MSRVIKAILITSLLCFFSAPLEAGIREIFPKIPSIHTNNIPPNIRENMLLESGLGTSGYSTPNSEGNWIKLHGTDSLTLFGIHKSPVTFKVYNGQNGFQLLAICRSRHNSGPTEQTNSEPHLNYDLTLYQTGTGRDLIEAPVDDYLPPIGILDYVTADTLRDPKATEDLNILAPSFTNCLTCHASTEDPLALDILTTTSISGVSCSHLLAQFKLLPLAWNGEYFTKPYDRAAPKEERHHKTESPKGLYYRQPGT